MATIKFKYIPEDKKNLWHARGWFVLGDHAIDEEGNHLLSAECVNVQEVDWYAKFLKSEIDKAAAKARQKFKKS